nr:TonB-dependent receptor [uncultured Sulfurimonas sp.]
MKKLFFIFITTACLFAQELMLDNLLQKYEDSESLYKSTKKESAGFLLVYSREDLVAMQAYNLKDILKTVRMYTLQIHNMGIQKLQTAGSGKTSMPPIKLYIDNYEVATSLQNNAIEIYGDMDIYFVDHIEIYQGGSSISLGNQPGSMVIKLYSKTPSRENSSSAQVSIDSKSGGDFRAVDAGTFGDYEYLFYADAAKMNYDKTDRNSQELSRDAKRYQAHFQLSQANNFEIVIDGIKKQTDVFNGFGSAPLGDNNSLSYGYISATKFLKDDLKISLSLAHEVKKVQNSDANGIPLPNSTLGNNFEADVHSNIYKVSIDKKIIHENSDLLLGAQFQQRHFNVHEYKGVNITPNFGPKKLDTYMLYLEELYNINKNHLLSFSAKVDYYKDEFNKDSTEYSLRLGYTALFNNEWSAKLFGIRRPSHQNTLQTSFTPPTYLPNPDLKSSSIDTFSGEIEYNDKKNRALFGYAYKTSNDTIVFDGVSKKYINAKDTVYFNRIYIRGEHKFDFQNKIIVEYYKAYKDVYASSGSGVLVQAFNKFGKFTIYNELIYREGYSVNYGLTDVNVDEGYEYTLGVIYPVSKNIDIKVKGENLLDMASETSIDPLEEVKVPATEKRVLLTMEYTF